MIPDYFLRNTKPIKKIIQCPSGYFIWLPQRIDKIFVDVYIKAGAITENKNEAGIGHLLEHYMAGSINQHLAEKIDDIRAKINDSFIHFYFVLKNNHPAHKTLREILDLIFKPDFSDEKLFQLEKQSIIREIKKEINDDFFILERLVGKTRYLDEPNQYSFVDHLDNIDRLSLNDLATYHHRIFTEDNLIFFLSGYNYDKKAIKTIVDYLNKNNLSKKATSFLQPEYSGFKIATGTPKRKENSCLAITFPCPDNSLTYKEKQVLTIIMMAVKKIHSNNLYINHHHGRGNGYLMIKRQRLNQRPIDWIRDVLSVFESLKKEGIATELLKSLKQERLIEEKNNWLDNHGRFLRISENLLNNDKVYLKGDIVRVIRGINTEDVKDLARKIFNQSQINFIVYGQFDGLVEQLNELSVKE